MKLIHQKQIDEVMGLLRTRINRLERKTYNLARQEIAPASYGPPRYPYASLPTASAARIGWHVFVTNGRKPGEGAGLGSGVLAYCAETSAGSGVYAWFRASDDSQVTV